MICKIFVNDSLLNVSHVQSLTRNTAIEVASTVKALYNETESLLVGRVSLVSYHGFNHYRNTWFNPFYYLVIIVCWWS